MGVALKKKLCFHFHVNLKMHVNKVWTICLSLSPTRSFNVLRFVFLPSA